MSYTCFICSECNEEIKINNQALLNAKGRKEILCPNCGNVFLVKGLLRFVKRSLASARQ